MYWTVARELCGKHWSFHTRHILQVCPHISRLRVRLGSELTQQAKTARRHGWDPQLHGHLQNTRCRFDGMLRAHSAHLVLMEEGYAVGEPHAGPHSWPQPKSSHSSAH